MRALPEDIQLVVLDFDGVLTDNRVIVGQDGSEYVICSRADGLGTALLQEMGIAVVILSSEPNPVVLARAQKLRVPVYQGLRDKAAQLRKIAAESNVPLASVLYVGNDINDEDCLRIVGCALVPADAHPRVRPLADIVLNAAGGQGVVRELADLLSATRRCRPADAEVCP